MRVCAGMAIAVLVWAAVVGASAQGTSSTGLQDDPQASLRFSGARSAELFSREIAASFDGVLEKDFVTSAADGEPTGFVNASPKGQPWAGTMWTRDSGTYLRELTMRGYYAHASLLADCLMSLVDKNADGFYSYPRFFRGAQHGTGSELDGTSAIVIGMVLLWERLPEGNATKGRIEHFLLQEDSPLEYFKHRLQTVPLLAGTGEFGCGMRIAGECDNVVQNNLVRLALLAGADMAAALGRKELAAEDRQLAAKIGDGMEKYLVDSDGAWIWAIDSTTLKAELRVQNAKVNRGFGGTNGVAAMDADVLGLEPLATEAEAMQHSEKTFRQIYNTPLRKQEFDRYGIWTQFDDIAAGMLTSPSYGQGYALQTMLLNDDLTMADKAMDFLANATYKPVAEYHLQRSSPYYFYERYYSPDAVGKVELAVGCGALNLVNVTEPLKVSRLMLGVDDSSTVVVEMLPRLPVSWTSVEARDWPIRTEHGVVRADITFTKVGAGARMDVRLAKGERIGKLRVRLPSAHGYVWLERQKVSAAHFESR